MTVFRWLNLPRLIVVITLLAIVAIAFRAPLDTDTYWHLRAGQWQVEHRALLLTDQFSATRFGDRWINLHWLSQLILFGSYALAGDLGLSVFTTTVAVAGMAALYPLLKGDPIVQAFVMVLGGGAAALYWTPRPQIISFAFSAVTFNLIWRFIKEGKDRLWVLPPLMILWANMHPGYALAFVLLALALGGLAISWIVDVLTGSSSETRAATLSQIRRLIVVAIVSALAVLINPFGLDALLLPFKTLGIGVLRDFIQEWATPNFHSRETWPFLFLLLATFGVSGLSARRLPFFDLVLLVGTALTALLAARNVPIFAIVALQVLSESLDAYLHELKLELNTARLRMSPITLAANWLILGLVSFGVVVKMAGEFVPSRLEQERASVFPVTAVEFINQTKPRPAIFNSYNWGGYLLWFAPDYPVYVDGRTDLYDDAFVREFLKVYYAQPGWLQALDEHHINLVLIETSSPLAQVLLLTPGWTKAYADDTAVVFERDAPLGP